MVAVGTWNLENLYRPGGQFGPKTQEAYEAKLATLDAGLQPTVISDRMGHANMSVTFQIYGHRSTGRIGGQPTWSVG